MLKGASFDVPPDTNALCQRMANEVHRDVLPGDSHVTAMESFKDEFGLRTSASTTPGLLNILNSLLKVMFVAMASRKIRVLVTTTPWAWYHTNPKNTTKNTMPQRRL